MGSPRRNCVVGCPGTRPRSSPRRARVGGARRQRNRSLQSVLARLRAIDLRRTIRLMARLEGLEIVREFQRNVRRVIKADAAVFIAAVAIVSAVIGCLQWYFIHRHFSSEAAELKMAN